MYIALVYELNPFVSSQNLYDKIVSRFGSVIFFSVHQRTNCTIALRYVVRELSDIS